MLVAVLPPKFDNDVLLAPLLMRDSNECGIYQALAPYMVLLCLCWRVFLLVDTRTTACGHVLAKIYQLRYMQKDFIYRDHSFPAL